MDLSDQIGLAVFTILFTFISNLIFKLFQNKFDFMVDTRKFKREYYFEQLMALNLELYAIIAQSEFLRYFHNMEDEGSFKEIPFLEIKQTRRRVKSDLFTKEILEAKEEVIENAITKFNKMKLIELILDNKKYASPKLIKLAVAYRYCHENYQKEGLVKSQLKKFQEEELDLIYEIIRTVISETNSKLKFCRMDYLKSELKTGEMDMDCIKKDLRKRDSILMFLKQKKEEE